MLNIEIPISLSNNKVCSSKVVYENYKLEFQGAAHCLTNKDCSSKGTITSFTCSLGETHHMTTQKKSMVVNELEL